MKLTNEFGPIRVWAYEKGIIKMGDTKTQLLKLQEEVGELATAILKNNKEEFIDAIGDCVVILTSIAELGNKQFALNQGQINIEDCINSAYDVIKSRQGSMINGNFVKQ